MRRGKEFYTEKVEKAKELHSNGMRIRDIAKKLGVSYSAVYHWVKGLRNPKKSKLEEFRDFLRSNGPQPVSKIERKFPKHNELYNLSSTRGIEIKRLVVDMKFKGGENYGTWYFLPGQEEEVEKKLSKLIKNYKMAKREILNLLEKISLKDLNIKRDK